MPDISKWNTKNITGIACLFINCSSLISLPDISKWNTEKLNDSYSLFSGCLSLIFKPDISNWNNYNEDNINEIPNMELINRYHNLNFDITAFHLSPKDLESLNDLDFLFDKKIDLFERLFKY